VRAALPSNAHKRPSIGICEIRAGAGQKNRKIRHVVTWCARSSQIKAVRATAAAADEDDLAVATWIVSIMNNGVPHVIRLLGIMTVVADVALPGKRMRRSVHFSVRRCQAIFNRYAHESILGKLRGNVCFHYATVKFTSVNYDRDAMCAAVVGIVDNRSNIHAINDFIGLN
jgi:hypothetical protein